MLFYQGDSIVVVVVIVLQCVSDVVVAVVVVLCVGDFMAVVVVVESCVVYKVL